MAEKKPAKEAKTYYIGTGRRKTAVARVRVTEGKGTVTINGRPLDEYFTEDKDRAAVLGPLKVTDQLSRVDVIVLANGGGITGQAGAVPPPEQLLGSVGRERHAEDHPQYQQCQVQLVAHLALPRPGHWGPMPLRTQ